ncbi:VOC family protein [Salinibacterium hongtaonis]|uniref:VOC domain-containing protein n=1 Tax=Homoserinimonas hongtaonis TaxID=2079791 RepID=A0A2U1T1L5_9MICO|nr:VOC family protein [Salinibacterium hongtaonis]PWB97769.1 hypothetical protein DF220_07960 [Salinibacterium hongtaonis]
MAIGSISEIGYVSLATRDLRASMENAEKILGLTPLETTKDKAYFSSGTGTRDLIYTASETDGADHFGLIAPNRDEIDAIRAKVDRRGYRVLAEQPIEDFIEAGFAFIGPEGFTFHVHLGASRYDHRSGGIGPDRLGHITVRAIDTVAFARFLVDVFDFRVSDRIGVDQGFFLRCNPDHHGIALVKSDWTGLHHHAWETQSIADLGKLGDRLANSGSRLIWGPVRHGAGHNIACYYQEPNGSVIELYTDLERIYDKERDEIVWDADDLNWLNRWDGNMPVLMTTAGCGLLSR